MDQQKIDRLFREKLDQFEAAPSPQSWSKVESQIRQERTPVMYWIAASVSLILVSWMVWPETTSDQYTPIASEVSYPPEMEMPEILLPVIKEIQVKDQKAIQPKPVETQKSIKQQVQLVAIEEQVEEVVETMDDLLETNEEPVMVVAEAEIEDALDEEDIEDPVEAIIDDPIKSTVKITYIASAKTQTEETKNDSTGVLKKFIAFSKKIDPGDMLADLKTAKDGLFNGRSKNKKEQSSM